MKWNVVLVMCFAAVLVGCDSQSTPTVSAAAPQRADAPVAAPAAPQEYLTSGPLTVEDQVDVPAQRNGVVVKLWVDVGEHVHQGQVLAELDSQQLTAERDAADADVRAYQANLDNWVAETKVLKSDFDRDQSLWDAKLITQQQLDHSRFKLESANYQIARDQQNVKFTQAKLRSAQAELDKARVLAPFDGVVARRYVRVGQKVAVGDRVVWVSALAPLNVQFTVPQEFAGKLKRGDEVPIFSPAAPDSKHSAHISVISPVIDPASGTFEVQARVDGPSPDLLPGMTVNIKLPKR